jgi:WD40 repeat protein
MCKFHLRVHAGVCVHRVWDLESHTCVSVIKTKHANKVSALAISEAGRLVSASQDSSIKLW